MMQDTYNRDAVKPMRINQAGIKVFLKKHAFVQVVQQVDAQVEELFLLRNPKYRFNKQYHADLESFKHKNRKLFEGGSWFYFPWTQTVVYFLPEKLHIEIKTGRNRNLISAAEQKAYYDSCIGIAGMSVGSHVALTIAMTGGAKYIKLADPDTISASNLNRIRVGFSALGVSKAVAVARQIYEINPYSIVEVFLDGITEKNVRTFLSGKRPLSLLVEEMDNPYFKILIRQFAKTAGVPVIMAADNGDGIIADVERFDLDKNYPILHDILPNITAETFRHTTPQELPQVIAKMAGADMAVPRMLLSVAEVGKTLYSWPQLGTAATMCGAVLAYLARKIVAKDGIIASGRKAFGPEKVFES